MSYLASSGNTNVPAPCIVDHGIVVNKRDIQRLLADLGCVHYCYMHGSTVASEGDGYIQDVFTDARQATLVTNARLYLNVCSFDYLELARSPEGDAQFNLIQDNRTLRLTPLSNPIKEQSSGNMNVAAIEAMVAEVLSANIDMRLDSGENLSF